MHTQNAIMQQQNQQQGMFPAQLHPLLSFSALGGSSNSTFDPTADLKRQYANKVAVQRNKSKYKKPTGKPKRPLSAYNIFFKQEREKLVKAKKKVGFANMAKQISVLWKALDEEGRKEFVAAAEIEQKRYRLAVKEWKQQSKLEAELAYTSCHSSSSSVASTQSSMATQPNHLALQRMMLEQQMMDQQRMMRQQMENALQFGGPRRVSMPMVANSMPPTNMSAQQQVPQNGRRFSMPLHPAQVLSQAPPPTIDMTQDNTIGQSGCESSDDSSFGDLTADDLINLPIMDLEQKNGAQDKGLPKSVEMPAPQPSRRSSMPTMHATKKLEWDVNPTPLPPGSRRLSLPGIHDEVKEMEDILAMLDNDDLMFPPTAA